MYHLPLLPGYGPESNIRSSAPPLAETPTTEIPIPQTLDAEEVVEGLAYFSAPTRTEELEGFVPSSSPPHETASELEVPTPMPPSEGTPRAPLRDFKDPDTDSFAEAVFFAYGVVVFLGLNEAQEQSILEDVRGVGVMEKALDDERWEVEECHYEVSSFTICTVLDLTRHSTTHTLHTPGFTMTFSVRHRIHTGS